MLFAEADKTVDAEKDTVDDYRENTDLWLCFEEETWKKWSVSEKITSMQRLVNFETGKLGMRVLFFLF